MLEILETGVLGDPVWLATSEDDAVYGAQSWRKECDSNNNQYVECTMFEIDSDILEPSHLNKARQNMLPLQKQPYYVYHKPIDINQTDFDVYDHIKIGE